MTVEFLLEIGTEEIPSDYLDNALTDLKRLAESYLEENRIPLAGELFTYGTPRRLVLFCNEIAEKQEDMLQEVTGPPKKAAYDQEGNPTKAAIGFAGKHGISVDDLQVVETPKGEYLHVKREIMGRPTGDVLSEILPRLLSETPWPKSMRWGDVGFSFVRPVHWILAILDGRVIPFEAAGVKSGNITRGHRFMSPRELEIKDLTDYFQNIKDNSVMINQEDRRNEIESEVIKKAKEVSGIPMEDPELVVTVSNLVEFPSAVCGSFDKEFLELPDPVLITAMRKHQKYFAIQDQNGKLIPHFVAVNNTLARDESVVRKGHERVLRARLSDAVFFFNEDRKKRLEERIEDLKGVIYQAELGTSFAKVERFSNLAQYLAEQIAPDIEKEVVLAARLCKCDLITEMVMEFPTLQGVMGMEYARLDGHPEEVCIAIHEHYLPARADDELPSSDIGAVVGLADRMDTIAGCFAIGLEPTGAADPFALRRHALAIMRILENREWNISLSGFISRSLEILGRKVGLEEKPVFDNLLNFFRERYKNRMLATGYETDLIEAVVSAGFDNVCELPLRMDQLKRFMTESKDFQALALTFKRVSNILKNQDEYLSVDEGMFKDSCESRLWETYQDLKDEIHGFREKRRYLEAFNLMARLRKPVDDFFDGVEVLTKENPELRKNRVAILQNLSGLFLSLADFSKFSI
ncbi:glycine--tRNA ligase subunit beta [Deltaproteobacteria bacterium]|nr:glycine--tRNA ligase subunit beta [Deltaproteobacteria bacterium]